MNIEEKKSYFVHPGALVETALIGAETRIWAFVHILKGSEIGRNCNICDHVFIEQGVKIGNNVTLKCGIYVWEGVTIEDDVFLGPNVVFTNDVRPRSKLFKPAVETLIKKGASIGANSTVLAGVTIGEYAMAGIGSVITRNVKSHSLVYGNPAKHKGWVDEFGNKLVKSGDSWLSPETTVKYIETESGLQKEKI
jgi:acetyltransferase-like isoleucine patch superfamily enzyme